jgi:hypothetical protein
MRRRHEKFFLSGSGLGCPAARDVTAGGRFDLLSISVVGCGFRRKVHGFKQRVDYTMIGAAWPGETGMNQLYLRRWLAPASSEAHRAEFRSDVLTEV